MTRSNSSYPSKEPKDFAFGSWRMKVFYRRQEGTNHQSNSMSGPRSLCCSSVQRSTTKMCLPAPYSSWKS